MITKGQDSRDQTESTPGEKVIRYLISYSGLSSGFQLDNYQLSQGLGISSRSDVDQRSTGSIKFGTRSVLVENGGGLGMTSYRRQQYQSHSCTL
jgi:hypothetical protein